MLKTCLLLFSFMIIFSHSVLAYSPQDNPIQQMLYELTGTYLGETYDELNQQDKLKENNIGSTVIPLEMVGINGVIIQKEATVGFCNNQLYLLRIDFDDKDIEKTKQMQNYFINKLGQPTSVTPPPEVYKKFNWTADIYSWENQTCNISVHQGSIYFSENNLSKEALKQGIINYIKYCQNYINYSKGNSNTQNIYYVGEKGKEFFEASMKKMIDSHKEMFKNDAELANSVKAYFADKPEYAETIKLFFE